MNLGAILLNEKTRISVSLATLLFVIGSTATIVYTLSTMKSEFDVAVNTLEINQDRIEDKFDEKYEDIEMDVADNKHETKELQVRMAEIQTGQSELKEGQARIETNILWIMNDLKDGD